MAKSKRSNKKNSSRKEALRELRRIVKEANDAINDPLESFPPSFLEISLTPTPPRCSDGRNDDNEGNAGQSSTNASNVLDSGKKRSVGGAASIKHFRSQSLPSSVLNQCLELFETNMGEMYSRSEWGLNVDEKRRELTHDDARFLVVLHHFEHGIVNNDDAGETTEDNGTSSGSKDVADGASSSDDYEGCTVLGFAHIRYVEDDDESPKHPVTYLYELQVRSTHQKIGLGKNLMTMVELIAMKMRTKKVMLTVFHFNEAAMGFYKRRGYEVDEYSPSNFEGGEDCDYEILSKPLGRAQQ